MRELVTQWRHTRMVVLTALTAAVYAAVLIPFKIATLIPGFTEIRPAVAIPVVFGLLFGPAGAWGAAFGNLIGDFFGTLGAGSLFGFLGNLFYGMVGYKLWGRMGPVSSGDPPHLRSARQLLEFGIVALVSSAVCAATIGWGVEVLGLFPFAVLGSIIAVNNLVVTLLLGPVLLWLLYPRVARWGLLWTEIVPPGDRSRGTAPRLGALLIGLGALGALVSGLALSTGLYGAPLLAFGGGTVGTGVVWGVLPFLLLFLAGCFLA